MNPNIHPFASECGFAKHVYMQAKAHTIQTQPSLMTSHAQLTSSSFGRDTEKEIRVQMWRLTGGSRRAWPINCLARPAALRTTSAWQSEECDLGVLLHARQNCKTCIVEHNQFYRNIAKIQKAQLRRLSI